MLKLKLFFFLGITIAILYCAVSYTVLNNVGPKISFNLMIPFFPFIFSYIYNPNNLCAEIPESISLCPIFLLIPRVVWTFLELGIVGGIFGIAIGLIFRILGELPKISTEDKKNA